MATWNIAARPGATAIDLDQPRRGHSGNKLRLMVIQTAMIMLQAIRLDAYGRFRYRIDFDGEVFLTSDAQEAAAKLASLGVQSPKHLVEHCRDWGDVTIPEVEEG